MMARRITAVPILAVGGLVVIAANVGAVVVGLYYEWVGLKMVFADGAIFEGLVAMGFVATIATGVVSLLALPGSALLHLGGAIWGRESDVDRPTDVVAADSPAYPDLDDQGDGSWDPKPFGCPDCGKRLATESGVAQHQAAKHVAIL